MEGQRERESERAFPQMPQKTAEPKRKVLPSIESKMAMLKRRSAAFIFALSPKVKYIHKATAGCLELERAGKGNFLFPILGRGLNFSNICPTQFRIIWITFIHRNGSGIVISDYRILTLLLLCLRVGIKNVFKNYIFHFFIFETVIAK